MPEVQFYFDFISPYSYLAFILLQRIAGPWELKIVYKPVRLPYIIKTTGNKPPASIPARAVFLKTDLMRSAQFYGIILRPPKDFLSISTKAPELVVHAAKMVVSGEDVGRIVKALWTEFFGKGDSSSFTSDPWSLKPLLDPLFPAETVESIITKAHEMDKTLRDTTDEALAAGAFGAPIMLITKDNQTEFFFGSDRFHHIAQFLDTDPRPLYTPQSKL
jgi:glutathione S-transferase kappa 1